MSYCEFPFRQSYLILVDPGITNSISERGGLQIRISLIEKAATCGANSRIISICLCGCASFIWSSFTPGYAHPESFLPGYKYFTSPR
jgi:hypothetical protein